MLGHDAHYLIFWNIKRFYNNFWSPLCDNVYTDLTWIEYCIFKLNVLYTIYGSFTWCLLQNKHMETLAIGICVQCKNQFVGDLDIPSIVHSLHPIFACFVSAIVYENCSTKSKKITIFFITLLILNLWAQKRIYSY